MKGSTLNFKKESAAFARALQAEHSALGALLDKSESSCEFPEAKEVWNQAKEAYEAVQHQRIRVEAAVGRR